MTSALEGGGGQTRILIILLINWVSLRVTREGRGVRKLCGYQIWLVPYTDCRYAANYTLGTFSRKPSRAAPPPISHKLRFRFGVHAAAASSFILRPTEVN